MEGCGDDISPSLEPQIAIIDNDVSSDLTHQVEHNNVDVDVEAEAEDECRRDDEKGNVVVEEEPLVQHLEKLEIIQENENDNDREDEEEEEEEEEEENRVYPSRPNVGNCSFYMKTGTCKFGSNCRFNHPLKQVYQEKGFESRNGFVTTDAASTECKYFSTLGWCKNGDSCRYNHSHSSDSTRLPYIVPECVEFNFLGLPIRPTGQGCAFYLRHGSCRYGSTCKFDHPNPTPAKVTVPVENGIESQVNKFRLPHELVNKFAKGINPTVENFPERPGQPDCDYYLKTGTCKYGSACRYNHPTYHPSDDHYSPPAAMLRAVSTLHQYHQNREIENDREFPERPQQPECEYYMKTGYCKFMSACRFHHPDNRVRISSSQCSLNQNGLPLRPGAKLCRNYEQQGTCKYGSNCLYNHPDDYSPEIATANANYVNSTWDDAWRSKSIENIPRFFGE